MKHVHLLAVAAVISSLKKKRTKRSKWTKDWLLKRSRLSHINLLEELTLEPGDWFNYLRMDEETYLELLSLVTPLIKKQDTHLRQSISPHERLTATLRYLATGRTYEDLKYSVAISPQALGQIIPETCVALYKVLRKEYLKFPKSEDEWRAIAKTFETKWNFPNCLGSVDGKHVQIMPPARSGSFYWNYKGTNSLVLMAIADANYDFIMVDFGTNGRVSDGGVIENTSFYDKLTKGKFLLPQPSKLDNSNETLPYVFIGDEAFTLRPDFLKPYSQKELDREKRIFNYRLSRARRIIENVFGILVARFQIFNHAINLKLENIEKVVLACCVLHNYLRRKRTDVYIPLGCYYNEDYNTGEIEIGLQTNDNNMQNLQRGFNRNAPEAAKTIRDNFKRYFCNEGAVPWQDKFI